MKINRRAVLQMLLMGAAATGFGLPRVRRQSLLLVTNSEGDDITVIDLERLAPISDWKVGEHPHGIAIPASGSVVYTTIESEKALKRLDPATGKTLSTLALNSRPNQCAVTPNGKFVAVPMIEGDSVAIVDVEDMRVLKTLPVPMPHNCLNAGNNEHMFVTSIRGNQVKMIDLQKLEYMAEIPVGGQPRPIAVDREEKTLYAALSNFHGFAIADIPSRKVVRRVEFPALPANTDLRPLLNTATHGLALTPDGKELWAASVPTGNVFVYDIPSAKVLPAIAVGKYPNWIAFSPDGRYGCITNTGSNDCSIVERTSKKEIARLKVGKSPKRLAALSLGA